MMKYHLFSKIQSRNANKLHLSCDDRKEKMESDAEVEEKNICEDELTEDGKIMEDSEEYEKEEEIFCNAVNVKGELVTNVSVDITKMKDEVNNNDGTEIKKDFGFKGFETISEDEEMEEEEYVEKETSDEDESKIVMKEEIEDEIMEENENEDKVVTTREIVKRDFEFKGFEMISEDEEMEEEEYVEKETSDEDESKIVMKEEIENEIMEENENEDKAVTIREIVEKDFGFKGFEISSNGNIVLKVYGIEVVKKVTKKKYNKYVDENLERIKRMENRVPRLRGTTKQLMIGEVKAREKMVDKEVKKLAELVIVTGEAEIFAKY